jgi:hypothetical protein
MDGIDRMNGIGSKYPVDPVYPWERERPGNTALVVVAEFVPWMGRFALTADLSTAKRFNNIAQGQRRSRATLGLWHPVGVRDTSPYTTQGAPRSAAHPGLRCTTASRLKNAQSMRSGPSME